MDRRLVARDAEIDRLSATIHALKIATAISRKALACSVKDPTSPRTALDSALAASHSLSSAINAHQNRFQSIAHTANLAPTPTIT